MKHFSLNYLSSILILSAFALAAPLEATNTWRFCNVGNAPVTAGPDLWIFSNPDPETIQPGQSYDFTTKHKLKGICYAENESDLTSCGSSSDSYHGESHSDSVTITLSNSGGSWGYSLVKGLESCPTTANVATSSSSKAS